MRLNRFLASSGRCSRRHADEFIFSGRVKVNGVSATSPGIRVAEGDKVTLDGRPVVLPSTKHYLVMNKPRRILTTMYDPQGRPTVRDVIRDSYPSLSHLKPVGRLDWDSCGVLLFTDDGDLHHALTHPSRLIMKEYLIVLADPLPVGLLKKIRSGIHLPDGFIRPDRVDYRYPDSQEVLVIHLHSGKNRIIRRILESVGGEVVKLQRLSFAGIPLDGLREGEVRELTREEVEGLLAVSNSVAAED